MASSSGLFEKLAYSCGARRCALAAPSASVFVLLYQESKETEYLELGKRTNASSFSAFFACLCWHGGGGEGLWGDEGLSQ